MSDFSVNEDSGYYLLGYRPSSSSGSLRLENASIPSGISLFFRVYDDGHFRTDYAEFTSAVGRVYSYDRIYVYMKPDADVSGLDFQVSYRWIAVNNSNVYYFERSYEFDVLPLPDAPADLRVSNTVVSESETVLPVAVLTGVDPDPNTTLSYSLLVDPTFGQLSLQFNQLVALNGLDFEAIDALNVYQKDGEGRLILPYTVRVTDNDGLSSDFERVFYLADVEEVDPVDPTVFEGTNTGDLATGTDGQDDMRGKGGDDYLAAKAGADRMSGGTGDDVLIGNQGNDTVFAGDGFDFVRGGQNNDRLYGGAGEDTLFGGTGNDRLFGGASSDMLVDGAGEDILQGGSGADIFRFHRDGRRDVLGDFEDGTDYIMLAGVNDISDLSISTAWGGRLRVMVGSDELIIRSLDGPLAVSDLSNDDFIFV